MNLRQWFVLILPALLWSCAGNETKPEPPAGALGMATPSEILRNVSIDDAAQVRYGDEYEAALPIRNAYSFANRALVLNPNPGPPLDPAWAIYSFDLTGYDEEPLIKLTWSTKPVGGTAWLMLPNWERNSWEFVATDPSLVELEAIEPYISSNGTLLVGVVVGGAVSRELRWVGIGDVTGPAPPRTYAVYPASGQPASTLTLNAQVTGTQPMTYAWDFGGAGTPNTSNEMTPTITLSDTLGDYPATLTLTNSYGQHTYEFMVHVVEPVWNVRQVGNAQENKFVALETSYTDHSLVAAEMGDGRVSVFEFSETGNINWNRAYTGLPANKVTDIALVQTANLLPEVRASYLACYEEVAGEPGMAYIVKLAEDGAVRWYQPLGPGIPDVSAYDDTRLCVSLARTDGKTVAAMLDTDGTVMWAKETVDPAQYTCSTAGSTEMNDGMFLAGNTGTPDYAVGLLRINADGSEGWAEAYSGNGSVADCAYANGTGVVVAGALPFAPEQKWDTFFMTVRADRMVLSSKKYRTHPNPPRKLSIVQGLVFLTCSSTVADKTSVFVLSSYFDFYRAIQIDAFGGLFAADAQWSRFVFIPVGQPPPPPPPQWFMFAGSGTTNDLSIIEITATPQFWQPVTVALNPALVDTTLPTETLDITPEEVTYTLDAPAGELDGLFMMAQHVF